jgi:hypothetical protein
MVPCVCNGASYALPYAAEKNLNDERGIDKHREKE